MAEIIHKEVAIKPNILLETIHAIREQISQAGGFSLIVGGIIRDALLGLKSTDIDIEVYFIDGNTLQKILENFGVVRLAGKQFGVYKVTLDSCQITIDVALARKENKIGKGHYNFHVVTDVKLSPEDAALRRDFTVNSFCYNPETKNIFDYFNGYQDLLNHRLVAVSEKFDEDPLRVLRGMRFAGRFDMTMDTETIMRSYAIRNEYEALSKERIWTEWYGFLEKSTKPSKGIRLLSYTGWLEHYPQIKALKGLAQDSLWHPEGDVYAHTLIALDEAVRIADRDNLMGDERVTLLLAALCHDFGKASTTTKNDEGRIISPQHAQAGVEPTEDFLYGIGCPEHIRWQVTRLVAEHMVHVGGKLSRKAIIRLAGRLSPSNIEMLERVCEADSCARPPLIGERPIEYLLAEAEAIACLKEPVKALLMGKDLIARGLTPGPEFGVILKFSLDAQEEGIITNKEEAEMWLDSYLLLNKKVEEAVAG